MGKVFISFLGTGNYAECDYALEGSSVRTRFVQRALLELVCGGFSEDDRIYFFLTEEARTKNWEPGAGQGLRETAESLGLSAKITAVDIPLGKSEDEIWAIFNSLYAVLQEGDTALFDITHAFRFLPMLGFATLHYSRYLKKVTVSGIYYGAFEAKDPVTHKTPIFDLSPFYNLMQWASAADTFVNYGISDKMQDLVRETARYFIGTDGAAKAITAVTESMATLRGADIVTGDIFAYCADKIDKLESTGNSRKIQPAFEPIFLKVKEKLRPFKKNSSLNFLSAVQWYMDHKMIPQCLTMMQEGLLTYLMDKKAVDYRGKSDRIDMGSILNCIAKKFCNKESFCLEPPSANFSAEEKELIEKWKLKNDDGFTDAAAIYFTICNLRNDVNHGGFNEDALKYAAIKKNTQKLCNDLERLCQELSAF